MIGINRIAYVALETPDVDGQVDHCTRVLGLTLVDRDANAAYLSTSVDHHTLVLRRAKEARCVALGFQVAAGTDLDAYARQIGQHQIKTKRLSDSQPGIPDLVAFPDSKGTQIEVFSEHQPAGHGYALRGVVPNKLGHVAYNVTDPPGAVKFYCDVLGFRLSDWMGDFFAFLRCGPDHHTINLVGGKANKMHHVAFELRDWAHIKDACDTLAAEKVPLIWGPVRHGIGHNVSIYHRNPDNQIVEYFCELDRMDEGTGAFEPRPTHLDHPQKPKVWTEIMQAASVWGIPPPEGFLD